MYWILWDWGHPKETRSQWFKSHAVNSGSQEPFSQTWLARTMFRTRHSQKQLESSEKKQGPLSGQL